MLGSICSDKVHFRTFETEEEKEVWIPLLRISTNASVCGWAAEVIPGAVLQETREIENVLTGREGEMKRNGSRMRGGENGWITEIENATWGTFQKEKPPWSELWACWLTVNKKPLTVGFVPSLSNTLFNPTARNRSNWFSAAWKYLQASRLWSLIFHHFQQTPSNCLLRWASLLQTPTTVSHNYRLIAVSDAVARTFLTSCSINRKKRLFLLTPHDSCRLVPPPPHTQDRFHTKLCGSQESDAFALLITAHNDY